MMEKCKAAFVGVAAFGLLSLPACNGDKGGSRVHRLQISRHDLVSLTNNRADQILADMTTVARSNDGAGDIECDVEFQRDGDVTSFSLGDGSIDSEADFDAVNGQPGHIKVVDQINWCGGLAPGIIGCAPVPGDSLVVVRFTDNQEGILWLHEFGHNQGLSHRDVADVVMRSFIGVTHRRVNQPECDAIEAE
ncbi:MAG: hypothetical protein FLDDKLPJ_02680 [Phycisphaerae bacterium]|nr:hypothetical protein [Phycisphaerae bacterium]